uniref:Capsid protein n=1 Tax=Cressdnaviricota sp. TaxID=2748378 RepID=A0A4D6IWF4_9VIRU|nr:capsid protein [Cressdnaviricota sp.]
MVFVKVSETYDLSTKIGKMGIVGIHTPDSDLITRHYGGFIQNMKFAKFVKCDVAMACASMLPADPLQIGMEAGSIAPQDMFNPILYTAVSNDSMSNILGFIQGQDDSIKSLVKNSIVDIQDGAFKNSDNAAVDQFNMYYALLSDADGWRKAMPQAGLEMRGLVPVVFGVSANTGMLPALNSAQNSPAVPGVKDGAPSAQTVEFIRGPSMRMPHFPTHRFATTAQKDVFLANDVCIESQLRNPPTAYVAIVVLPPAKQNQLYYRLKVTWTIEFSSPRSMTEVLSWRALANLGEQSYGTDYATQSKAMAVTTDMVDTQGADINKIMEGSA